jgi:hypothetical protein
MSQHVWGDALAVMTDLGQLLLQCVFGFINIVGRSVAAQVDILEKLNVVRLQDYLHKFSPWCL